jgi:hypothetical protein
MIRDKDLESVYLSEKSRGSKHQQTPETIADIKLQREIVKRIVSSSCDQRGLEAILRDFGLQEGSSRFLRYVRIWQQWRSGKL